MVNSSNALNSRPRATEEKKKTTFAGKSMNINQTETQR